MSRNSWVISLAVLAIIVGIELITFGSSYKRTGFYLDDWLMLRQLTFGPTGYFDMLWNYLVTDPRVVIRPLEALHFGTVFYFSGCDPTGWRISNMVLEIASCFLTYLIVARLSLSRLLGFVAAVFFLAYPAHDATHYWAVCTCVPFSLALYLLSLWSTIKSVDSHKRLWLGLSYLFFALSIYGYEPFLPLAALNVVAYVWLTSSETKHSGADPASETKPAGAGVAAGAGADLDPAVPDGNWDRRRPADSSNPIPVLRKLVFHSLPYACVIASLLVYQRFIVPQFCKAALHGMQFNPMLILSTIGEGLKVISPIGTAPFIAAQVQDFARNDGFNTGTFVRLAIIAGLILVGVSLTAAGNQTDRKRAWALVGLGALTVVVSYSIFGLNSEYEPTLVTILNRINTGAAFGLSILMAGVAGLLFTRNSMSKRFATVTSALVLGGLTLVFTVANWSLAKPWEISWAVQKRTFDALRERKAEFADTKSIVLINCPRYVNCSPVFDGTWDFEEMLRISLGRTDIKGGVVSERMKLNRESVQDVTIGYVNAEYPFEGLVLVTPGLTSMTPVVGARHFIDTVETQGTEFGLSRSAIASWREQLSSGVRRKRNGVLVTERNMPKAKTE